MRTRSMAVSLSLAQVIGLIAIVVVLVFGLTLAWRFLPSMMTSGPNKGPEPTGSVDLVFDETRSEREDRLEKKTAGHRNFWFRNTGSQAVEIRLHDKFCQCQTVKVCLQVPAPPAPLKTGATASEWSREQLDARADDPDFVWQVLETGTPVTIPAGAQGGVQLSWNATQTARQTFWAKLSAQAAGGREELIELSLPVDFIEPVNVALGDNPRDFLHDNEKDKIELRPGEEQIVKFLIWSPTRDKFNLKAEPPVLDPECIKWGEPKPLTADECRAFGKLGGDRVRSGYRLEVVVRERATDGNRQLPLGPFRRSVTLTSDEKEQPIDPMQVAVSGRVHGEVSVLGSSGKGVIDFRQIKVGEDKVESCLLVSGTPGLKLELDPEFMAQKPDYIKKVILDPEPAKPGQQDSRWKLTVTVGSKVVIDSLSRKDLREQSVIVLRTNGTPPRTLRIPVTGTVYR